MATKTTKSTKNKTPTNKKPKVDQKESVNFQIHETIQTFVLNLKQDDEQTRPFKSLLLPFIAAIVLVGISVSTSAILPAGIIGAAFGELILKKIFEGLGTNILWDVIQSTKNLKNSQQSIDVILQNRQLIKVIDEKLIDDVQFRSDVGKMLDAVNALSTFTDKAREIDYDEIIQELCSELEEHREILRINKEDLKVILHKDWGYSSQGYIALEKILNDTEEPEKSKNEATGTLGDPENQDKVTSKARLKSSFVRVIRRFSISLLPARVLLWMLSWIASILIAVWILHLAFPNSLLYCKCDQFSLSNALPMFTLTPTDVNTVTVTITPSPTETMTATPTISPTPTKLVVIPTLFDTPAVGKTNGQKYNLEINTYVTVVESFYGTCTVWAELNGEDILIPANALYESRNCP